MILLIVFYFFKIYNKTLKQRKYNSFAYEIANKKTMKFEIIVNNLKFFDFILQINMLELYLTILSASFLQQLKNLVIKH